MRVILSKCWDDDHGVALPRTSTRPGHFSLTENFSPNADADRYSFCHQALKHF